MVVGLYSVVMNIYVYLGQSCDIVLFNVAPRSSEIFSVTFLLGQPFNIILRFGARKVKQIVLSFIAGIDR